MAINSHLNHGINHRHSPSSNHFLSLFSPPPASITATNSAHSTTVDLLESDIFFPSSESLPRRNSLLFSALPKPPPPPQQHSFAADLSRSAPISIPPAMIRRRFINGGDDYDVKDDGDDDEEMLPPHELVALKVKATSSVLEGFGRTLKGRDLRQVRNAVWRRTGFAD